jgi:drug/metabolite transporter (DMT)-like permease
VSARQLVMLGALSAIWGASYLLIKIALHGFHPGVIVFLRVLLSAVLLYAVIRIRGGKDLEALAAQAHRPRNLLIQGALAVALPFMLIAFGEQETPSGLTGVLVSPGPLFVALLAPAIDASERVGRRASFGLALGFAGVILLIGLDTVGSVAEFLGALAIVGAAFSYALGAMFAKLRFEGVPPLVVSCGACAGGALVSLPVAAVTFAGSSPDLGQVAAVVALGAVGTAAAFVLYFTLIAEVGAGRASLCGYLIPPTALAYGALLLDEQITAAAIAGLTLILAGVALAGGERGIEAPAPESEAEPEPAQT